MKSIYIYIYIYLFIYLFIQTSYIFFFVMVSMDDANAHKNVDSRFFGSSLDRMGRFCDEYLLLKSNFR